MTSIYDCEFKRDDYRKRIQEIDYLLENRNLLLMKTQENQSLLILSIIKAYDLLPAPHSTNPPDSFVVICIDEMVFKTKVVNKSFEPDWNETFKIDVPASVAIVDIFLTDEERFNNNRQFQGKIELDLDTYADQRIHHQTLELQNEDGSKISAMLEIKVQVVSSQERMYLAEINDLNGRIINIEAEIKKLRVKHAELFAPLKNMQKTHSSLEANNQRRLILAEDSMENQFSKLGILSPFRSTMTVRDGLMSPTAVNEDLKDEVTKQREAEAWAKLGLRDRIYYWIRVRDFEVRAATKLEGVFSRQVNITDWAIFTLILANVHLIFTIVISLLRENSLDVTTIFSA
eukprot:TRINITY_DN963_c0_g2_i3.p1 TRINITY_DN963_c0_g2~~TRINITY_DN963_c0_g2_i3.p1  ORF type:complete len:345 (-),score=67.05 TRINITY_DN963_c0_g2_i3:394-1428(-)